MAEGVAATIEVKSDLKNQWSQECSTVSKIKELRRTFSYQYWENMLQELESGVAEGGQGEIESSMNS